VELLVSPSQYFLHGTVFSLFSGIERPVESVTRSRRGKGRRDATILAAFLLISSMIGFSLGFVAARHMVLSLRRYAYK
jgi:hypothetical protein